MVRLTDQQTGDGVIAGTLPDVVFGADGLAETNHCLVYGIMVFACMIVAFVVALAAMDGWEKLKQIWERTKDKDNQ